VTVIYFLGFTLNTFTLLGLSLAVGLVVDDAVMVMENIYRHAEMGKDKVHAAADGTKEITFAALAATIAVIAIFLPVIFMDGIVGRFFFQFGVTLSVSVLLSYFEAITLAPARCAQILDASREGRSALGRFVDDNFSRLERFYSRTLGLALHHPLKILAASLVALISCAYLATKLPSEFIPSQDQSRLNVRIQTQVGMSLTAAKPLLLRAQSYLAAQPEVEHVLTTLSGSSGSMTILIVPPENRKVTAVQLSAKIRKELGQIAGIRASVQDPSQQGFGASKGYPIDISVRGSDWDQLIKNALQLRDDIEKSGYAVDLNTDYQVGTPEVQITPDRRRASDLGISVSDLATTISALVGGSTVGKFETGGRRIDIRTRLLAGQRTSPEDMSQLRVRAQNGQLVPMSLLVTQDEKPSLQAINRVDRERAISITGNVAPGKSQNEALAKVTELGGEMPSGYRVVFSGQSTQFADTTSSLGFALIVGIMVAYMVLASQFNSLLDPITVLTILPLALCGAVLGLLAIGATVNLFSMIGILLLMGIVKKNSIILVEYANQVREHEHVDAFEGMHKAGPLRLRPILMTTVATMMSAVPSALGLGPGSETRGPMAAAVLGGLTVSTILSLVVVPCFYVTADRIRGRFFHHEAAAPGPGPLAAAVPAPPGPEH
jgi:multidrug efflux pump subunit AcrB